MVAGRKKELNLFYLYMFNLAEMLHTFLFK